MRRVREQQGEPWRRSLLRVAYLTACVLFDGVVLTELPRALGRTPLAWGAFAIALLGAVALQVAGYRRWLAEERRPEPA